MIESVHGAITLAIPAPIMTVMTMTCSTLLVGSNVVYNTNDTVTMDRPVVTTILFPNLCTHTFESGAKIMIVIAWGNSTAPASTVEYPSTDCRYCVSRNNVPKSERNTNAIAPLAALNRGFWKKCMSSIG